MSLLASIPATSVLPSPLKSTRSLYAETVSDTEGPPVTLPERSFVNARTVYAVPGVRFAAVKPVPLPAYRPIPAVTDDGAAEPAAARTITWSRSVMAGAVQEIAALAPLAWRFVTAAGSVSTVRNVDEKPAPSTTSRYAVLSCSAAAGV